MFSGNVLSVIRHVTNSYIDEAIIFFFAVFISGSKSMKFELLPGRHLMKQLYLTKIFQGNPYTNHESIDGINIYDMYSDFLFSG